MKRHIYKLAFVCAATTLLINSSCTDLTETVYSQMLTDNYYNNRLEVMSGVARPYTHMRSWVTCSSQESMYTTSEFAADQLAWPVKGPHGRDDDKWIDLHYHQWTVRHPGMRNSWNGTYTGIGYCNDAMENLHKRDAAQMGITEKEKTTFLAELRMLRAYHHMRLMDMFGNIPICEAVGQENLSTQPRKDVFDWIEAEYLACIDDLDVLKPETIGRVAKAAGYAMLAELYLNAEVWSGTARWEDCSKCCDKILSGESGAARGVLKYDEDLLLPFSNVNGEEANENIFVIAYNYAQTDRHIWFTIMWHGQMRQIFGSDYGGYNGIVVVPTAYEKYDDRDLRKQKWMLIGPQYKYNNPTEPVLGTEEYKDQPLVFVPYIRRETQRKSPDEVLPSTMFLGEENSGARINKYNPGSVDDMTTYHNNDWVMYRLSDIHYMKAEALMRSNNGNATQEAVDLVNARLKYCFLPEDLDNFLYTTTTLTLDELLDERGREFIFEGKRRTDLIRFGKFVTGSWWDHEPSNNKNLELFPLAPQTLAANPNLKQNPGYATE